MKISGNGIALIKKYEGCRLTAYKADPSEKMWTVGYGHYGVEQGATISQAQADQYLEADIAKFDWYVNRYVSVLVTQNMHDALVSFTYNLGAGTLKKSSLLEKLNRRDYIGAADVFPRYNKAGGRVLNGLVRRRQNEREVFLTDMGILEYSRQKDGEISLSKNFKVKEFACKDGSDRILIDADFVRNYLQKIRDHFGTAVMVNSAYRSPAYNRKVGGAKTSYHMKGQAFDIVVKGHTPVEVARYAQELGIKGIIRYNSFVHVDSRPVRYWAINDGTAKAVSSF